MHFISIFFLQQLLLFAAFFFPSKSFSDFVTMYDPPFFFDKEKAASLIKTVSYFSFSGLKKKNKHKPLFCKAKVGP